MNRKPHILSIGTIAALSIVANASAATLTHHMRDAVRTGEARPLGRLPAGQVMKLDIVLPLKDSAGLKKFLGELSNPASPNFRKFLTVQEFTEKFGPTQDDYNTVVDFAKTSGFKITGGSRDGMDILVEGTVSVVENAFNLKMWNYQHPTEDRIFYAPDQEPNPNLSVALWHVSGLDNFSIPKRKLVSRTEAETGNAFPITGVSSRATTGSGPSGSFLGSDMRAAYYGNGPLTGAGQNLGLFEYLGTDLADLNTYFTNIGQTNNVPITLLSTDGTSTSCVYVSKRQGCDDTEQTLDMTQAIGMAPGLASLTMYVGTLDTAIISAMTTHVPLPTTIGCSWGWLPADPTTLDPYFERMAAQGQNFFAASGDSSTWSKTTEAWPADDANIVSVGGTDLVTASAAGPWLSETAWVDSGGGISPDKIAIPSYQLLPGVINSSNGGSTTLRNGPDVSANANFTFYVCADQTTCTANLYGGTSFAAPMWAGYLALVNQALAAQSKAPIGFINPIIYNQNVTSAYTSNFHDIVSGTSGSYSAETGYDLVTGWGSPNAGLLAALVNSTTPPPPPGFTLSANPTSLTTTPPGTVSTTITSVAGNGFNSSIALTASGQPTGAQVTFSPASITGSGTSTMSVTVTRIVKAGTYLITVSGAGGGVTATTTVTLIVN